MSNLLPVIFGGWTVMTPMEKRNYVSSAYPGPNWKAKVAKMSDAQVTAVYLRLISKTS